MSKKVTFWAKNLGNRKTSYSLEILETIFSHAEKKHGPVKIKLDLSKMSTYRALDYLREQSNTILLTQTERINGNTEGITSFSHTALDTLDDLYVLMVRGSDLEIFEKIYDAEHLKLFTLGIGKDLPNTQILKMNGFDILIFPITFEGIRSKFLKIKRIDYTFIKVLEHKAFSNYQNIKSGVLALVSSYWVQNSELPTLVVATADLNDHLQFGLKKLEESGNIDEIKRKHFGGIMRKLEQSDVKILKLFDSLNAHIIG